MTDANAPHRPSVLQSRLAKLIRANGPIRVSDFMADALTHPQDGYYTSQAAIGGGGDFTTSPEISQVFGEMIGAWLIRTWIDIGEPSLFYLVELGPGRGVLMADILRTARIRPKFLEAARVRLVETSGRLRHTQQQALAPYNADVSWFAELSEIPPGPTLLVANEFFDCLPIRQFVRAEVGWRERMIGLKEQIDGTAATPDELAFTLAPEPGPLGSPAPDVARGAQMGAVLELCAPALELMDEICQRLLSFKGRALIIDYGHMQSGLGDTLQAVRDHAYWPTLATPGEADLTAHVDFEMLKNCASDLGAVVAGPTTQRRFLDALGINARRDKLTASAPDKAAAIAAGVDRLIARDGMGALFKAMCVGSPSLPPAPGFPEPA